MRPVVFPHVPYRGQPAPIVPVSIKGLKGWLPIWVPLRIGPVEVLARLGFSPRLGVGFNLLGRQDIFTHFDITFSDAAARVTFRPRRSGARGGPSRPRASR